MKKDITNKELEIFSKKFNANKANLVIANAVQRNGVNNTAFVTSSTNTLTNNFSIDVKSTGNITNQKQSGRCWMFAGLNVLRVIAMKALHVKDLELSESYLMFYDKLEKCNSQLEAVLDTLEEKDSSRILDYVINMGGQQDGGYWNFFTELVRKYGVCPKACMNETIPSSSSSEMDNTIQTLMAKDMAFLRNEFQKGTSKDKLAEYKQNMLEEIYKVLSICIGTPISSFTFEYEEDDNQSKGKKKNKEDKNNFRRITSTPKEFFDKYIKDELDNYVLLVNWPIKNYPMNQSYITKYCYNVINSKPCKAVNVSLDEIKKALIKSLKDNRLSWFACDVLASSCRKEGYLATEILDLNGVFNVDLNFDKGDRLLLKASQCNHAMTFTGVNLDDDNKPNRWKVENSWGTDVAFKGFYIMSDKWFDEYVYEVVVEKKYCSKAVLEALDTTPIELEPWAPVNRF